MVDPREFWPKGEAYQTPPAAPAPLPACPRCGRGHADPLPDCDRTNRRTAHDPRQL